MHAITQLPLTKPAPVSAAAGKFNLPPKKKALKAMYQESRDITKAINAENELQFSGMATAVAGGKLSLLKPPVNATADEKQKGKKPDLIAPMKR
jgi:hypothetical protein